MGVGLSHDEEKTECRAITGRGRGDGMEPLYGGEAEARCWAARRRNRGPGRRAPKRRRRGGVCIVGQICR
jgi:hypothetical protein